MPRHDAPGITAPSTDDECPLMQAFARKRRYLLVVRAAAFECQIAHTFAAHIAVLDRIIAGQQDFGP